MRSSAYPYSELVERLALAEERCRELEKERDRFSHQAARLRAEAKKTTKPKAESFPGKWIVHEGEARWVRGYPNGRYGYWRVEDTVFVDMPESVLKHDL